MRGLKRKIVTGCGNTHLTAFFNEEGKLQETFYSRGSAGGCESSYTAISRLVSLACREGIPAEKVIDQLKSVQPCPAYRVRTATKGDTSKGTACASAMAFALEEMIEEMAIINDEITDKFMNKIQDFKVGKLESQAVPGGTEFIYTPPAISPIKKAITEPTISVKRPSKLFDCVAGPMCPECGQHLRQEGGCMVCKNCGWSKCD